MEVVHAKKSTHGTATIRETAWNLRQCFGSQKNTVSKRKRVLVFFLVWFCLVYRGDGESLYLRSTLISFSSESSLPFSAFLSIILTAYILPGCSLLSASRTSEKAPLQWEKRFGVRYLGCLLDWTVFKYVGASFGNDVKGDCRDV